MTVERGTFRWAALTVAGGADWGGERLRLAGAGKLHLNSPEPSIQFKAKSTAFRNLANRFGAVYCIGVEDLLGWRAWCNPLNGHNIRLRQRPR
jgi:hypothetical protein